MKITGVGARLVLMPNQKSSIKLKAYTIWLGCTRAAINSALLNLSDSRKLPHEKCP
jgi:hypothetical protein